MAAAGIFAFAPIGASASTPPPTTTTGLGLDPKNDPTVYTTQQGLEIKKSNGYISGSVTTTTNRGTNYTQDLSGFYYFTMGTFSGTIYTAKTKTDTYTVTNEPVNWLIIGRGEFNFYDDTPAGSDIQNDINNQEIALQGCYLPLSMSSIPQNEEIPQNSFLVLSEKLLGQMYFNSTGIINNEFYQPSYTPSNLVLAKSQYGNRYRYIGNKDTTSNGEQSWTTNNNTGGSLYNYINNLFSKNNTTGAIVSNGLGFSDIEANMIVPQQLYTYYSNGGSYHYQETPETDGGTYYSMFPLAHRDAHSTTYQNFCVQDYLSTIKQSIATLIGSQTNQSFFWWLRSGYSTGNDVASDFFPSGEFYGNNVRHANGVRPAFVMKLQ